MDENLTRQLEARFAELPEDVQRAIQSSDLETKIHEISKKYQLHVDQEGMFGDEVRLVMLGLVDPADFSKQLSEGLKIPSQQAEQIAADVSAQLFVPIRNSMRAFVEEKTLQQQAAHMSTASGSASAEKSVVMPSAASAPAASVPAKTASTPLPTVAAPAPKIQTPPATPAAAPASAAAKPAEMHAADMMLHEPTVTVAPKPAASQAGSTASPQAKAGQVQPVPYKVDPYREPPE